MEKTIKFKGNKLIISTHLEYFVFFKYGQFDCKDNKLSPNSINTAFNDKKGVYCFVKNKKIIYVGKTDKDLCSRINQYINPGITQFTNRRIKNTLISKYSDSTINIYFLNCEHYEQDIICMTEDEKGHPSTARIIEMIVTGYCWNKNLLNK